MRPKKAYVASMDQVRITRERDHVQIEYAEPGVEPVKLDLGPRATLMTDEEILDLLNEGIRARDSRDDEYEHVAVEVPPGLPQIRSLGPGHWAARGDVLRCVVGDPGPDGQPVIYIDDQTLSVAELGRMLGALAGWGMRIAFVPEDQLYEDPEIEVRDPTPHDE